MQTIKKTFRPSSEMVAAAEAVFLDQAFVELVRPIVIGYQTKILAKHQWEVRPEFSERLGKEIIVDPKHSYLMSDEDFAKYDALCRQARDAARFVVSHDDKCPLLCAEDRLRKSKRALCNVMAPITGITTERIGAGKMEVYDEYIELALQLLGPYVRKSTAILAA